MAEEKTLEETAAAVEAIPEDGEEIDELDDMEFLLEEIENRIAPLA
ncbi:ammosamide/lymphostin RiPP family protein [Streptomyces huiliensis]|nr:ammosamide/lymphostin RiPP family protein [Streptomyces huiliensis]MBZ4319931.1 ammosamide/lymphostin RiPP family protein [Streptomyces huiliensis]